MDPENPDSVNMFVKEYNLAFNEEKERNQILPVGDTRVQEESKSYNLNKKDTESYRSSE